MRSLVVASAPLAQRASFRFRASPHSGGWPPPQAESNSLTLPTSDSPPVALHPASRRRSFLWLQTRGHGPGGDLHPLMTRLCRRTEPARPAPCVCKRETDATPSGLRQLQHGSVAAPPQVLATAARPQDPADPADIDEGRTRPVPRKRLRTMRSPRCAHHDALTTMRSPRCAHRDALTAMRSPRDALTTMRSPRCAHRAMRSMRSPRCAHQRCAHHDARTAMRS